MREKLVQQIQDIKDRAYDKGAGMVLADLSRLGHHKLVVKIMQNHHLDLEHFEELAPVDYRSIKGAWMECGLPVKKVSIPTGRPRVSDPRHRAR